MSSVKRFEKDTIEHLLDLANAADQCTGVIYPTLVSVVDNNNIKTGAEFESFVAAAETNWKTERDTGRVPNNSTFRTAKSTVRKALDAGISFFDADGAMKGKTQLGKEIKDAEGNDTDSWRKGHKALTNRIAAAAAAGIPTQDAFEMYLSPIVEAFDAAYGTKTNVTFK